MSYDTTLAKSQDLENAIESEEPALLWLADDYASMLTADEGNIIIPEPTPMQNPEFNNKKTTDSIEIATDKISISNPSDHNIDGNNDTTSNANSNSNNGTDPATISETIPDNNKVMIPRRESFTGSASTNESASNENGEVRPRCEMSQQPNNLEFDITVDANNAVNDSESHRQTADYSEVLKTQPDEEVTKSNGNRADEKLDDGDDVDSEEFDDEEKEEDPPILKYSRLNQLPPNLFKTDPVSTTVFHESVFMFGTHSGYIHICKPDFTSIRTFKAHRASVLSLYTDGVYFASGSMDGTIVIGSVSDSRDIVMFDYKRPIHAVVLDRNYQRSRSFVCGGMGGKVIYSSKNWLDQRVDVSLDEEHGPIISIQAVDDLILWMNDKGITVYHISTRQIISVIEKPSDSFRSDLYWPRVSFPETDRVLIAWGNYIWSLRVSVKGNVSGNTGAGSSVKSRLLPSAASLSFRTTQEKSVSVEHVYKVDYLISGIAAFNGDQWIVLAYNPPLEDSETGKLLPQNPDLKLIRALDGATIHEEEIGFDAIENLGLNDYSLGCHIGQLSTRYFIISARGGVIAQQIQLDDRLQWYIDRELFQKAWKMSKHLVKPQERLNFGIKYLDQLVKEDKWEDAATWMAELLYLDDTEFPIGDTKSTLGTRVSATLQLEEKENFVKEIGMQWNLWCDIFIRGGHEKELTRVIPKDPRWSLQKDHYSKILQYWLSCLDTCNTAYDLLKEWDIEIYNVDTVSSTIELILELHPDNIRLRKLLCDIYENSLEPSKVITHMHILRDPSIIQFLDQNHILPSFISDIPAFIKLRFKSDTDIELLPVPQVRNKLKDVTTILVKKRFEILPETIVKLMSKSHLEIVNYLYLEELAAIDDLLVLKFENTRIELYCQFDRPKLLPFLMNNLHYDISKAIELCETSSLIDELVYLLGKTGENKKALKLIMEELDDPERAIKFAKTQTDPETWDILLEYSFSRPAYIKALIELSDDQSNKFYNPITILQRMNTEVAIEGLKESITRVSLDNDLNVIVNQLVLRIVYKRSEELSKQLYHDMLKGFQFSPESEELKTIADLFETFVVTLTGTNSSPTISLVSSVVERDGFAYRLSSDLLSKLEHIRTLHDMTKKESFG